MENNEKNLIKEKEQNPAELGSEQMEQVTGGDINFSAILQIAADQVNKYVTQVTCKHEPDVLLSTSYQYEGGSLPYLRKRTYRCCKCGNTYTEADYVAVRTL